MPALAGKEDWEVTAALANAMGCEMNYSHPSQIMDEIARLTPTFHGVSYARLDELGSIQWPCNELAPQGTPTMHVDEFVRGKGYFAITGFVPTSECTRCSASPVRTAGTRINAVIVPLKDAGAARMAWVRKAGGAVSGTAQASRMDSRNTGPPWDALHETRRSLELALAVRAIA